MNIFVLSFEPAESARFHCNKHVVKMIIESAQMLCTAHWLHLLKSKGKSLSDFKRIKDAQSWLYENTNIDLHPPYKMTHTRHPCTVWTSSNIANYFWQLRLLESLLFEYKKRYKKIHKTKQYAKWLRKNEPVNMKNDFIEEFPVCMKDNFKVYKACGKIDVVASYRNYYIKDKVRFAKWEPHSRTPDWFLKGVNKNESNNY